MDDPTAITRIKQGDPHGLEILVTRYQVKAISSAFLVLHDQELSEEVVQEAFVRMVEKIEQFDERRPFAPWFFRIVLNEAVKLARQQNRLTSLEEEPDDPIQHLAGCLVDPNLPPEKATEIRQSKAMIWAALKRLPPEQRAVVVMRYYLEMPEADMANQMDRPVSTIKWWLRAARDRLATLLRASRYFEDRG
jgi:RNA polymerase sigma-70 factor (ECF subfamily)